MKRKANLEDLEKALGRTKYIVSPQKADQLIRDKFQDNSLYDFCMVYAAKNIDRLLFDTKAEFIASIAAVMTRGIMVGLDLAEIVDD